MKLLLGGLFLLGVGAFMLLAPETVYDLTESWKSDSPGSPSPLYRLNLTIGGIACCAVGGLSLAVCFFS